MMDWSEKIGCKKHSEDFEARRDSAESAFPSPKKKARVDEPATMTKA